MALLSFFNILIRNLRRLRHPFNNVLILQYIFSALKLGNSLKALKYLRINCFVLGVIHNFFPMSCEEILNSR